jgi:hypothetical protein
MKGSEWQNEKHAAKWTCFRIKPIQQNLSWNWISEPMLTSQTFNN